MSKTLVTNSRNARLICWLQANCIINLWIKVLSHLQHLEESMTSWLIEFDNLGKGIIK